MTLPRRGPVTPEQRLRDNLRTQAGGSAFGQTPNARPVNLQKPLGLDRPPTPSGGAPVAFARYTTGGGPLNSGLTGWNLITGKSWGNYSTYISYGGTYQFDFLAPCCVQVAFNTVVTGATAGAVYQMSTDCGDFGGIYDYIIAAGTTASGAAAGPVTYCDSTSASIDAFVNSINGSTGAVNLSGLCITIWPAPAS